MVERQVGRDTRDAEVAAELNVPRNEYFNMLKDLRGCRLFGFEDMFDGKESACNAAAIATIPMLICRMRSFARRCSMYRAAARA